MTRQIIRGACPHDCPDTCGIVTEVEDGRAVDFYGDPDHPVTQGWLCAKVRPYLEHVYHPDRLTYPLRRVGPKGSGQWARISWAEAINEIVTRWQDIIQQYGAAAILPYSYSGTLGLVQMLVSSTRFWNRLGASQLERTICGAAAEFAVTMTLGARHSPAYEEVVHSNLVVIWGHNPVSTAPHFMPHLKKAQRQGTKVVVIDPRRTRTARGADWHIAPIPNTDGALALGLAHVIVGNHWHDEAWLRSYTIGWDDLKARLKAYTPSRVAAVTGIPEQTILELAALYATTKPALIKIADGLQRHRHGGQSIRAILTLPALTGQYGQRGGGLGYSTSGYVPWDTRTVHYWHDCPPSARSINMNRLGAALTGEATDPPVMSLYVFGANPATVSPNAGKIVQGLKRDDLFTVVHELFMTDTADYADLILPATSQLEHADLHKGYGHTALHYNPPAIPPLGECKSNWDVLRELATALGFEEPWLHQTADEVIDEILTATAANNPHRFEGITLETLKANGPMPLTLEHPTPFAGEQFPTISGKVELYSEPMAQLGHDPIPGWPAPEAITWEDQPNDLPPASAPATPPLKLITAAAHHFVTSTFAAQQSLRDKQGAPFVEIHPDDASLRHIADGDTVVIENSRGWCKLKAVVSDAVRPGVLASPKGHWAKHDPFQNGDGGRNVNWTVSDALADIAGQSTFHSNQVWLRKANQ